MSNIHSILDCILYLCYVAKLKKKHLIPITSLDNKKVLSKVSGAFVTTPTGDERSASRMSDLALFFKVKYEQSSDFFYPAILLHNIKCNTLYKYMYLSFSHFLLIPLSPSSL